MNENSSTLLAHGVLIDDSNNNNNNVDGETIIHPIRPSVSLDSALNESPSYTKSPLDNANIMTFSNRGGNTTDSTNSSIFRPMLSWATNNFGTKSNDDSTKSHPSPRQPIHESIIPHYTHRDCPSPTNVNIRHRTTHHHHHHVNNTNDGASSSLHSQSLDDADVAAGSKLAFCRRSPAAKLPVDNSLDSSSTSSSIVSSTSSSNLVSVLPTISTTATSPHHLAVDHYNNQVDVLGVDISHLPRQSQFFVCATGVFVFTLGYGFLQELIAVHICYRKLGLFLAMCQFSGYTFWSYLLRNHVDSKKMRMSGGCVSKDKKVGNALTVPWEMYLGLSLLRALDLAMTNMAMQYINYPAKTLMKSSRVVWTMLFGAVFARKRYRTNDWVVVIMMAMGLFIFMRADAKTAAVFQPMGVIMLTTSLLCDGAITNLSEVIMKKYNVGQDEFIFKLYTIALVVISGAAWYKGELSEGMKFLAVDGTLEELQTGSTATWSSTGKIFVMVVFSTLGFFGSSCSAAITKNFGALTMSITSTARKATTLFLSFALFPNTCTIDHILGIVLFICSLLVKSYGRVRRSKQRRKKIEKAPLSAGSESDSLLRRTESAAYLIV